MRFYEYEAKALFARHGAPLLRGRLARTAAEAKAVAAEIGGPVVLKSQVLTGGRMKAGGVKFADTADEAESAAQAILALEIKGQKPRGVLVEQRAGVAQEYFAAVTWDGRRKLPVLVFSDMGGIDIEEVAETHPEHVAQVHLSTLLPFSPFKAKEAGAAAHAVRDPRRRGRRLGPPRRGRQRRRVRRRPRARDRGRRRLAHALRRDPQARRAARELLRDRRQPERQEGVRADQAHPLQA